MEFRKSRYEDGTYFQEFTFGKMQHLEHYLNIKSYWI